MNHETSPRATPAKSAAPAAGNASNAVAWPRNLAPLLSVLRRSPKAFDFFQAVRALERLHPQLESVGRFAHPANEVVTFTVNPSIAFPPAEIHALDLPDQGRATMCVNFMGLVGPQGVMPHAYSLLIAERLRARDSAPAAFLDLFHHRILSLFYRAWQKNRATVCFEKQEDDRLSEHLLDLVGLGTEAEGHGLTPLNRTLLFSAGLLASQTRSTLALEQLLEDVFSVDVEIEQFVGGWYALAEGDQCALGEERGASTQLGLGVVAGDEVWDQQTRVRIRLGPLTAGQYATFLPTGSAHALLRWLVRFFSRDAFDFELRLVMQREHVAGCVLGDEREMRQPLGWSTWIRTSPFERDPDETILEL